jgi:hypothetical protein
LIKVPATVQTRANKGKQIPIVSASTPDISPPSISAFTVRKPRCDMAAYVNPHGQRRWRQLLRLHTNRTVIDDVSFAYISQICVDLLPILYLAIPEERRDRRRNIPVETTYTQYIYLCRWRCFSSSTYLYPYITSVSLSLQ